MIIFYYNKTKSDNLFTITKSLRPSFIIHDFKNGGLDIKSSWIDYIIDKDKRHCCLLRFYIGGGDNIYFKLK